MSNSLGFKVGDRVRVTGTVASVNTPYRWIGVHFGYAYGIISIDAKGIDLENLGPADPDSWPPRVGDIWEAKGVEYFARKHMFRDDRTVLIPADASYVYEDTGLKALNPKLIRRRAA